MVGEGGLEAGADGNSDEGSRLSCPYPCEGTILSSIFICLFPFLEPPLRLGLCPLPCT